MNNDDAIRIMLNAAPVCGTVWNREGRSVDCNDAALRFFGLTSKQDYLDHHADLSPQCQPDGTASALLMRAYLRQAFEQGQAEFSWLHRRLDGELISAQLTLTRICNDGREWVLAYAVALPIPLADSPASQGGNVRASMLLDNAPWACILWNAREEIVDCNVEAFQRFGLGSKQEYLERFTEFLPEFQPCGVRSTELMKQYIAQARQTGRLTIPWMHRSAAGEPMSCEVTLVHTMEGNEPMLATFVRDLWAEQRLAAEKRAADERIQIMLDATPACITFWSWDEQLRLIDCNQEAANRFDLGSRQDYLDNFNELSPKYQPCGRLSSELALEYVSTAFHEGLTRFSWSHQKLNGEPMPSEITLVRARHGDKFIVVGHTRDLREEKRLEAEKREADERIQIMLDATPACITFWSWDEQLRLIDCNQEAANRFDLGSRQDYLDHFLELSPEYQPCGRLSSELALEYVSTAFHEGLTRFSWLHQKLNGEPMPSEITLVRARHGDKFIVVGHTRDLREEKRLEAEMRAADERIQIMLDATPLGCTLWDDGSQLVDCNQETVKLFGLGNKQEFLDRFLELSPEYQPDGYLSAELVPQYIQQALRDGYLRIEWMHRLLNGDPLPAEITLVRVRRAEGYAIAAYVRDLRELKENVASLSRLEKLAYTDKLTGVANRHGFLDNAIVELEKLAPEDSASVLMFDIDHFKQVNDTYGHIAGDMILHDVAERIQTILRPYDLFARYGGEEFVLLLTHTSLSTTHSLAERVRDAIAQSPFEYRGMAIAITISIGVASCGSPALPLHDLLDLADTALYQAKHRGRNRVEHASSLQPSARTVALD